LKGGDDINYISFNVNSKTMLTIFSSSFL